VSHIQTLHEISVSSEPAAEPVTLAEAKAWAKIDFADDDALGTALLKSAREIAQAYTNRAFITQTLIAYWKSHEGEVVLPRAPIQSVTTVVEINLDVETTFTVDQDFYVMGVDDKFLRIERSGISKNNKHPRERFSSGLDLKVTYVAGYGNAGSDVPDGIKDGIKSIWTYMYEHRGEEISTTQALTIEARLLLDPLRIFTI